MKTLLSIALLTAVLLGACTNRKKTALQPTQIQMELKGVLSKQGITTYQYGTHVLTQDSTIYALKSTAVNLDKYINQTVTITGDLVKGYPLSGGPLYIEVKSVK